MKSILSLICVVSALSWSGASATIVTPGDMNGWSIYTTDDSGVLGTGSGTGDFVAGPATPPLGTGSGHLMTPSGGGDQSVQFRDIGFAGTKIADLTVLGYSTYATANNGSQVPYLTIWLNTGDRLQFEPAYSSASAGNSNPFPTQPYPALNTWQTWNALDGMWYSDESAGPGSNAITLAQYLAIPGNANATIVDALPGIVGGIRLTSGFASPGDDFDTNIDNFTIGTAMGTTTFDFEPTAVPELSSFAFGSLLFGMVGVAYGYRKLVAGKTLAVRDA
ncbi:MAG TPA: hypothetical protein VH107_21565 [Lacipirellulaceae bacterium]|jgi:hypothetical protein|nr:hypothetical protein [Lacipirellulaceae bacterium]